MLFSKQEFDKHVEGIKVLYNELGRDAVKESMRGLFALKSYVDNEVRKLVNTIANERKFRV